MSRPEDDLTATRLRDPPIDDLDTVADQVPPEVDEDSSLSGPYLYYESSPGRDDEETRRIVKSALKLLLGPSRAKR